MLSNQSNLDSNDRLLSKQERNIIHDRLKKISLDTSSAFVGNLKDINLVKQDRILTACFFDLIPSIDQLNDLDKICQQHGKQVWLVTDNIIDSGSHNKFKNISVWSYLELLGMTTLNSTAPEIKQNPNRLYNCFMQRCDSVRQSWFYFLQLENLLDSGYVSYLLYQLSDYSNLTGQDLFEFIHYHKGLDSLANFQKAYDFLKSTVPYRNFIENSDLTGYISDSKYSLILETYAVEDDRMQWCFTEKLIRSLQLGSINLIFAQKHSVSVLKDLGFDVDAVNEQFDNLDWISRQKKILEILVSDSIEFDSKNKYNQCMNNRALLNQWKKTYHRPDFFDNLKESILTL